MSTSLTDTTGPEVAAVPLAVNVAQARADRRWRLQEKISPYLFVAPFFLLFCLFFVEPLCKSLTLSMYKTAGPRSQAFVGLENYKYLIVQDRAFRLAVLNTAAYAVLYLIFNIPLALILAVVMNHPKVVARNIFRFAFFSSHLVGNVFVAVIFGQMFSHNGLVNTFLERTFHIQAIPWTTNPHLVLPCLLTATVWMSVGYSMIYFLAALQAVDKGLYEAAAIDGAGRVSTFWHVTVPGIRPVLIYMILVGSIGAFQLFDLPYVMYQGAGPGGAAMTIVMYLFTMGFGTGDLGYASAVGWTLFLMLATVALVQMRILRAEKEF
jgi:ABC-type sugar transport system permease subunit